MPWSVVAPEHRPDHHQLPEYHGEATFNGGTVAIQNHVPMWANMKARFTIDGSQLHMTRIDLETDGAQNDGRRRRRLSPLAGETYQVKSRVQFPADARDLLREGELGSSRGDGDFTGTFHLFKGGHDLAGSSPARSPGVDDYRFPALYGSLHWTRKAFEVTDAGARLYGGDARFGFRSSRSDRRAADRALRRVSTRTSISRRCRISTSCRAAVRRPRLGQQPARVAARTISRAPRRRRS